MASEALEYVRDRPTPRLEAFDLADLVDEVGITLQEQGEDADPNQLRNWVNALSGERKVSADRDLLYRDRKSTRLNSSHIQKSRMPSSA